MLKELLRLALGASVAVAMTGCAADSIEEGEEDDVDTVDSALAPLEYKVTHGYTVFGPDAPYIRASWGSGYFVAAGTAIEIRDKAADGYSVGGHWILRDREGRIERRGICRHVGGNGTFGACDYAFSKGYRLSMRLGRCDGDRFSCRNLSDWRDWTPFETGRVYE